MPLFGQHLNKLWRL